jgi:glucokinase
MPSSPLAIGIDFGGTSVKFGVCAGAQIIASAGPIDTTAYRDGTADALIVAITDRVTELKSAHPQVSTVGAGIPGLVDFQRGHIFEITNVPGWKDVPFRDLLSEKTGLPATVDNDANCMAYAEWHHGAGRGYKDLIAVTLGTGVGGGLIIGGQLHRGAQFCAGEIGHTTIDHTKTHPGGIIEKFVGNRRIATRAKELYAAAGIEKSEAECTPQSLAEADDEISRRVWQDTADWLGIALGNAIWLLNPEAIIIGGGIAKAGQVLFDPLHKKLQQVLSPVLAENIHLIPARFGNEAGIIGAAAQSVAGASRQ